MHSGYECIALERSARRFGGLEKAFSDLRARFALLPMQRSLAQSLYSVWRFLHPTEIVVLMDSLAALSPSYAS